MADALKDVLDRGVDADESPAEHSEVGSLHLAGRPVAVALVEVEAIERVVVEDFAVALQSLFRLSFWNRMWKSIDLAMVILPFVRIDVSARRVG